MDFPPTFQQNVNAIFVKLDKAADHVPIVSYASNAVNLFQKIIVLPLLDRYSPGTIEKNHYLTHIQDKKTSDCIFLIIPGASMFIYLGEKAFSHANKNLDEDLKHFKTKDNETVVKNQESKNQEAAVPPKLKTYEIERNSRIEKNLPQLSSKVENLVVQLENHLAENNHSLEEAFSTPFDSSTENITMESFIEKFNSQVNLRLKVVDQLKNNYSDLSSVKTLIIDCKNANVPIPLTPNQKDKLINQLNAQLEIYNELHHDLDQLYKWGGGELGRAQLKLKKDEYPCVVANFISNPPSNITIQNKSDLELLIKAYNDYLAKLKNTNKNLEGMIGMRKALLNEMKESQNPESI